jgi:hypothetical protein
VLCVTSQGEQFLRKHDPVNPVLNAVAALDTEEHIKLRDSLKEILNRVDTTHHRFNASICRDCMFLAKRDPSKGGATAEFMCRFYRTPIPLDEVELLCISFERAGDRP